MRLVVPLLCTALAACAAPPAAAPPAPASLFHDALFAPVADPDLAGDIFALSPAMDAYLRAAGPEMRRRGLPRGLVEALYQRDRLQLDYDAALTRTAAQAFAARKGNCLSLVIMTAAMAHALNLQVIYQAVDTDPSLSRSEDLLFLSNHVNLKLVRRLVDVTPGYDPNEALTIDFLPPAQAAQLPARPIGESTIIAMYRNNRAAEALARGQIDAAYWWVRGAVTAAAGLAGPYNTLGVVYLRHGDLTAARTVLAGVLQRDPDNRQALNNLAIVYDRLAQPLAAAALRARLARVEPVPPYHYFFAGKAAMERGDYAEARTWFEQEVRRADYCSEFHFWLGLADLKLGNMAQARTQITLAMENSTTGRDFALYAGKLEHLKRAARAQGS